MQPPFSERFGDIYFSGEDGLAETRHVFLRGNSLPERWDGKPRFTIAETGFGTGLNFLAAWAEFEKTAHPDAVLDYIAVELYPLKTEEIRSALSRWKDVFEGRLEAMLEQWPLRVPGFHRLHFPRVRLTLIFDDVKSALPQIVAPRGVDAWFLDGFAPAKNPDMWSEILYREMARLSAPEATAATFTAAGHVRRGLTAAGFAVDKVPGFGRKRDMTVARWTGAKTIAAATPRKVAVIGGGLAGTACVAALSRRRIDTVLYEEAAAVASGASGNRLGLCNPRFFAQRTSRSDFYAAAYDMAARQFKTIQDARFNPCGSLHLINTEERGKRFASMLETWRWAREHLAILNPAAASDCAGVAVDCDALYLPESAQVDPSALCRAYVSETVVKTNHSVKSFTRDDNGWAVDGSAYDAVVLACGAGMGSLTELPLHTVRGQVTWIHATERSRKLRVNLCYGGYLSAPFSNGLHMAGSTFQKWLTDDSLRLEDDESNLAKLFENVPSLIDEYKIAGSRAALRTVSRDHFPIAGSLRNGLFVSTGHGSHGILSSLICGEILADMMDQSPLSLSNETCLNLSPLRFVVGGFEV